LLGWPWNGLVSGLAIAKMLLRAADRNDAADALDDARIGWDGFRTARGNENALGKIIARELEQHLGGASDAVEADLRAATQDVADLFSRLGEDDQAVIGASTHPDQSLDYAKRHGGDQKRRLISERATPVFDHVLGVACVEFARLAPSFHLRSRGPFQILRQLPSLADDARRAAGGVDELLRREDRNAVAASLAATEDRAVLGRLVSDWTAAELGVHQPIIVDDKTGTTAYVLRDHDTKLREALAELKEPGARPRLITVVGTS
jgi:hypothetical protein